MNQQQEQEQEEAQAQAGAQTQRMNGWVAVNQFGSLGETPCEGSPATHKRIPTRFNPKQSRIEF